jgi:hydroxymethylbilane synthase
VSPRRTLTVGTRGSRLALRQTELVVAKLREQHADVDIDVREIRTEGDRRPGESLAAIGGQGVFVREIEAALLRREIDFAIHSLKDVPADLADGCVIAAVPKRADPRDALVTKDGARLADLPSSARIGTGSERRAVQLRALRGDIEPVDIRGNVETRIRKVDEGAYAAAVLAVAGLERLGLLDRAAQVFEAGEMLPAVGQGALAVEARADDTELLELLAAIDDRDAHLAVEAERAFLQRLGGGCRLPFGALAEVDGETLRIRGFLADDTGAELFRSELTGGVGEGPALGVRLAHELLTMKAAFDIPTTGA